MKFLALATIAATLIAEVSAHTREWCVWVDGHDQGAGAGNYIRQPPTNDPIKDLTSSDMRCNVGGDSPAPNYVTVPAGSELTTEWFHNVRHDDIIAASHKGPFLAYLAPASSNGEGNVWVKIFHEGYTDGHWAIEKLLNNKGMYNITIPRDLIQGQYLLRVEPIALHEAYVLHSKDSARGAQFFPSCVQIQVTGDGTKTLPSGVALPGAYNDSTPGVLYNIYDSRNDLSAYPVPGPPVVQL